MFYYLTFKYMILKFCLEIDAKCFPAQCIKTIHRREYLFANAFKSIRCFILMHIRTVNSSKYQFPEDFASDNLY